MRTCPPRNFAAVIIAMFLAATGGGILVTALPDTASASIAETDCTFAQQLADPASQAEYRARLARLEQTPVTGFAGVDDMYRNITKASYNLRQMNRLDPISFGCVTCHDGATAPGKEPHIKSGPAGWNISMSGGGSSHPVGMRYAEYAGDSRNYIPMGAVSTEVTFIQGKVGCLSCHDMLNPLKNHLVMSNDNSNLCFSCHIK